MPTMCTPACSLFSYSIIQLQKKLFPLLLQLLHGRFQRLRRLDDVIVAPEVLVPVFVHHIVEHVTLAEGILQTNPLLRTVDAVHHHHLRGSGEGGGEQALLPVALEAHHVTQIVEVRPAVLIAVGHEVGHLHGLEPEAVRLLAEDAANGLFLVTQVQVELGTADGECLLVDVEQAIVERLVEDDARFERHDILHAVVDAHGKLHLEAVTVNHVQREQLGIILRHVQIEGNIGPAGNLHRQRVTTFLALQPTAFQNLHPVVRDVTHPVIRLVDIRHGFGHPDVAVAFLDGLTIEGGEEMGVRRIVLRHAADGLLHQRQRRTSVDVQHVEGHRGGCEPDDGSSALVRQCLGTHRHILIAEVRHHHSPTEFLLRDLEREHSVGIGNGADVRSPHGNVHIGQRTAGFLVLHDACHEQSSLRPCGEGKQPHDGCYDQFVLHGSIFFILVFHNLVSPL